MISLIFITQEYRRSHNNQSGVPIRFCGGRDELIMEGCPSDRLVGPSSEMEIGVSDNDEVVWSS